MMLIDSARIWYNIKALQSDLLLKFAHRSENLLRISSWILAPEFLPEIIPFVLVMDPVMLVGREFYRVLVDFDAARLEPSTELLNQQVMVFLHFSEFPRHSGYVFFADGPTLRRCVQLLPRGWASPTAPGIFS